MNAKKIESKTDCLTEGHVLCPWFNTTGELEDLYCCSGYCIDLLNKLAAKINFTFNLSLSPDGEFGSLEFKGNTGELNLLKSNNVDIFFPFLLAPFFIQTLFSLRFFFLLNLIFFIIHL